MRWVGKIGFRKGIWDGALGGENWFGEEILIWCVGWGKLMMAWEFLDVKVGAKDFDF